MHLSAGTRGVIVCLLSRNGPDLLHTLFVGVSRHHTVVTLRLIGCAQCAVCRQAGRQAGTARILSNPAQPWPSPLNLSASAVEQPVNRRVRPVRPSVRRPLANVGLCRVRGGRGVERCERQGARGRVISEVTGDGSRVTASCCYGAFGARAVLDGWSA